MPGPFDILECRYLQGATMSKIFTDASSATWAAGTAGKLDIHGLDVSGLPHDDLGSAVMKESLYGMQQPVPGPRSGNFSFSAYCGSGSADTTPQDIMTFLAYCFGNSAATSPAAKTDAADSAGAHTTSRVYCTAHGQSAGCFVKVGAKGDGRSDGVLRRVTAVDTDYIDVAPDLPVAPNDADALVFSHYTTANQSYAARYFDFLMIGQEASNGDQIQTIGGTPTVGFEYELGSPVIASFDFQTADWQWVPAGELDQIEAGQAADNAGEFSPPSRLMSQFTIYDTGGTYVDFQAGAFSVDPGIQIGRIQDPNGPNGVGGWGVLGINPVIECTALLSDQDTPQNLLADFTAGTVKGLILAAGYTAQNCMLFDMPHAYLIDAPKRVDIDGFTGLRLRYGAKNQSDSQFRVHWL